MKIHWLGAGLSSGPGLRYLAARYPVLLWNRSFERALPVGLRAGISAQRIRVWNPETFARTLEPGDLVISYFPANRHPEIAALCLQAGAHLFTSSYVSPELKAFSKAAKEKGLFFVNELGLDPGLDHFLAHSLVDLFRASGAEANGLHFFSACGGFPAAPGEFKYKFSWSPLGVLRALRNPARWLEGGVEKTSTRPYREKLSTRIGGETFEYYPNRDSLPFLAEYGLAAPPTLSFQRATLRPLGWRRAWREIFAKVEEGSALEDLAAELANKHSYDDGESDRILLHVHLRARHFSRWQFDQSLTLDATGNHEGSAMARAVSGTTALVVELFLEGKLGQLPPGVQGFPKLDPRESHQLLAGLPSFGLQLAHLADPADFAMQANQIPQWSWPPPPPKIPQPTT